MTNDDATSNNNNNNHPTNKNSKGDDRQSQSPNSISSSTTTTTTTTTTLLCNASASALASIISRLCTHPLDTIKARIQIFNTTTTSTGSSHLHALSPNTTLATTTTATTTPTTYYNKHITPTNNMFLHQIRNIIRESGTTNGSSYHPVMNTIKTLYRGLGVVIIGGTPGTMLYLCSYDMIKQQLSYLSLSLQQQPQHPNTRNHHSNSNNNNNNNYNFLIHFTSGMIAESIACIVYVPVDVIKERMQVQQQQAQQPTNIVTNHHQNHHPPPTYYYYRNTYDAVRQILHTEGIRGIYRGYTATLASFGPFSALYFVFYEYFKHSIHTTTSYPSLSQHEQSQQLPVPESKTKSSSSLSVSHYVEIPFHWTVLCAATAGGLASFITSPLDMAKLRLQVQRGNHMIQSTNHPNHIPHVKSSSPPTAITTNTPIVETYTGMMDCLQKVYRQHGIRGLFRGAGARVLHFAPATTVTMTTYETLRQHFEAYILQHQ